FTIGVALLALLSAVVLAPMIEEILFRGILQRWLSKVGETRSHLPDPLPQDPLDEYRVTGAWSAEAPAPMDQSDGEITTDAGDGIWADDTARRLADDKARRGSALPIMLTSLLFAAVHVPQWPAPIGLFLLSIALGAVYERTGSLIAVITMHATFNGFST